MEMLQDVKFLLPRWSDEWRGLVQVQSQLQRQIVYLGDSNVVHIDQAHEYVRTRGWKKVV